MLKFEHFVHEGKVVKRAIDPHLARALTMSSADRLQSAKEYVNRKPKYAFEDAYEAVIELIDGLLAAEGYKSYSHEANMAFLLKCGFLAHEVENLDRIRRKRHGCKYYARSIETDEAKTEIDFLERMFNRIMQILKAKLGEL